MRFDDICQAFVVLKDSQLKIIYDKYGEYGLKEGIIGPDGVKLGGGWFMQKSSTDVYDAEFASTDPFGYQDHFTEQFMYGSLFANATTGQTQSSGPAPSDIEIVL